MLLARRGKIRSTKARSQGSGEISGNGRNETQEMDDEKKNSDLCNKWVKGGDLCELWAETSETKVAAPEGRVARGGICLAAGEEGAIQSEMAMGKWGAKTLEMVGG